MFSLWKFLTPPTPKSSWQKLLMVAALGLFVLVSAHLWPAALGRYPIAIVWLVVVGGGVWYGGFLPGLLLLISGILHQVASFPGGTGDLTRVEFVVRLVIFVVFGIASCLIGEALHHLVALWRSGRQSGQLDFTRIAEESPGFVWSTQTSPGEPGFVNKTLLGFVGAGRVETEADRLAFVHPDDRETVRRAMALARETLTPYQVEYRFRRADGEYRWVLEHGVPRSSERDAFEGFIGLGADITELRKEREELLFIGSLQSALASSLDLERTASAICEALVPSIADWCVIQMIRESSSSLEPLRVYHSDPERARAATAVDLTASLSAAATEGAIRIAREGRSQFVASVDDMFLRAATSRPEVLALLRSLQLVSFIGVPLRVQGRIVGVLSIATAESRRVLTSETLRLMEKIGGIVSFAIENGRLYEGMRASLLAEESTRRKLEASDKQFRSAWDSGIFGMCIVERDGAIRAANPAFIAITGQAAPDIADGHIRLRSRIDDREVPFGSFLWERVSTETRCEPFEKLCIRADGTSVPVLVGGSLHPDGKSCIVFLLDLTERKRMESALEKQRVLLKTIIDAVPALVGYIGKDRKLTLQNRRYEEWFGLEPSELDGKPVGELQLHGARPEEAAAIERAFLGESVTFETRISASERERFVMVNLRPGPDLNWDGKVEGVVVHAYDVTEPKLLAAAVSRSEKRYRTLVTATAAIVWAADPEGRVKDVFGWEAFTGRRLSTDRNADWLEAIHPDDREHLASEWRRTLRMARPLDMYYRLRGADGRYRHVHSRSAPLVNSDGQVEEWIGYVADVTQRVEAEQLLRRKEAELQLVVDTMPALVSYVDNRRRYVYANAAYQKWFGIDPQELRGKPIEDILGTSAYQRVSDHIDRVLSGEVVRYEEFLPYLHGQGRWVEATLTPHRNERGEVLGYFGLIIDVSDRKQAERERTEMLQRYRFLADAMPQNVWTTDGNGVQDYFNERWLEYTGDVRTANPDSWADYVHPEDRERSHLGWKAAVASGDRYRMEHRLRDRDGHYRWFLSLAIPRRDESGRIVQWVGTSTNIDALRRTNAELDEARAELRRHADTLELIVRQRTAKLEEANAELEAFSYSVSHDLRVPLHHIQVFVEAALEDTDSRLTEDTRKNLKLATSSAERMDALITDLLAYSRLSREDTELEKVDLEFLIAEGLAALRATIEACRAQIKVVGPLPSVRADRVGLQQVLRNLLSNALKFLPKDRTPEITLRAEVFENRRTRLWVEDNGIGIDPRHHGEVFKLFKRVYSQGSYSGTGIGLSLVRKAMLKMGGECGVESRLGEGSRFWVEFPAPESP